MLAEAKNAQSYREWAEGIADASVRDAFRYLVGLAAEDPRYTCYPQLKGIVRDFRFYDSKGEQPFTFIVNRSSLLFYFRKPAISAGLLSASDLEEKFDSAVRNNSGEFTIKLRSIADVQRLWQLVGPDVVPYQSGGTETTQLGYVNRNQQQCGGHRGLPGTDHLQFAYRMVCLVPECGEVYGANGTDVFQRKCPKCQGGEPGLDVW